MKLMSQLAYKTGDNPHRVDVFICVCAYICSDAEYSSKLHIINAVGTESVATFLNVPSTVSVL